MLEGNGQFWWRFGAFGGSDGGSWDLGCKPGPLGLGGGSAMQKRGSDDLLLTLIPTGGADSARTFSYHQTASTMKELAS